ncbi:hypothetical protein R1flu_002684 [Riccia fluitans]|uniref:Uncharacterized protein n=1 Tax=Riccia fluitans TaxID=41844 RepID=A0ABD1Y7T4_9MARC
MDSSFASTLLSKDGERCCMSSSSCCSFGTVIDMVISGVVDVAGVGGLGNATSEVAEFSITSGSGSATALGASSGSYAHS